MVAVLHQLRARRALSLYKVHGDSALLALNWRLKTVTEEMAFIGFAYELFIYMY